VLCSEQKFLVWPLQQKGYQSVVPNTASVGFHLRSESVGMWVLQGKGGYRVQIQKSRWALGSLSTFRSYFWSIIVPILFLHFECADSTDESRIDIPILFKVRKWSDAGRGAGSTDGTMRYSSPPLGLQ